MISVLNLQAARVRASIFNLAMLLIDAHMSVEFWVPPSIVEAPLSKSFDSTSRLPASPAKWLSLLPSDRPRVRYHPLAEIVIWNGVKELRRYRQPKIQPRDAIIQGIELILQHLHSTRITIVFCTDCNLTALLPWV
eukprot:COSAG05_NODE_10093_length_583_cov_1.159091_1_plen_136_part_00